MRWAAGVLAALVALIALAALALWFVGRDLDRPWIKSRVVALAAEQGFAIDYEGLALSLADGIRARSFRMFTPPAVAAGAPECVRVDDFELSARLWRLALGGRTIERLRVGRVSVAIVSDESGRTTLSELFPARAEEPKASTPLSRSLEELPRLAVEMIDVGEIQARWVELRADGSQRVSTLSSLGARGKLDSGSEGLAGSSLAIVGAPLAVEISEPNTVQRASLGVDLNLNAPDARSLGIGLKVELQQQDIVPSWGWRGDLLELSSTLRFDAAAGETTIAVAPLAALRRDLSLEASSKVFDGDVTKVVTSGTLHVDLAGLPFAVEGLALEALKLELSSRELAWDGARISGSIDAAGSLRGAIFDQSTSSARVMRVTLGGRGAFQPDGGRFEGTLKAASLGARSPGSSATAAGLTLELSGTTRELAGAQQIEARAHAALDSAQLAAGGQVIELAGMSLQTRANASALDLAALAIPRLEGELSAASVELREGARRTRLEKPNLKARVDRLVADAAAELGAQGDVSLSLSVPVLRQFAGSSRARPALSLGGLEASATLPLTLARAQGTVTLASLRSGESSVERLGLDVQAETPLAFAPEREGGAQATLSGGLGRIVAGGQRASLSGVRLLAGKLERDRYRLELDATGSSLALGGQPLPGEVQAEVRAEARPLAGSLTLSSSLRGEGGAHLSLGLTARFERASERLVYDARLAAEKLAAFAGVAAKLDARSARVALGGARLRASARGDLAGVLHAGPDGLPAPVQNPLGNARGTQTARLELAGLDYRGPESVVRVPELELELESLHRAAQGGNASARLTLKALELEGGGMSVKLAGLDQKLVATFERAPDQGMVDVHTSLALDSAAQSWLPGYPARDLTLSTNLQIDRLRSIFLRELTLDNPASGSSLRASGTLELLAQGNSGDGKTIAGREALSFEGRLEQKLATLEQLGIASHARGTVALPFRLESGGLLGYRLLGTLEAKQVSLVLEDGRLAIDDLNGSIPMVEEFALLPSGPVIGAGPRTSPLSDTRFFDVHPFLSQSDYVTARSIGLGGLAPLGPIAANVRVERSDFVIDQLQTGYRGGQIVGQVRVAWRDGDPIVRLRLNATGVRSGKSNDVFDANTALTFVPAAMTLDGKMQIVRASREHLEDILDVLDPFHESANANRVRQGLALGYPKFVRFQLHDGAIDTKVELGGLAQLIRIDEIRAVPLGPILQKYVAPALSGYLRPRAPPSAPGGDTLESALREDAPHDRSQPGVNR